jgi:hypothetical protein
MLDITVPARGLQVAVSWLFSLAAARSCRRRPRFLKSSDPVLPVSVKLRIYSRRGRLPLGESSARPAGPAGAPPPPGSPPCTNASQGGTPPIEAANWGTRLPLLIPEPISLTPMDLDHHRPATPSSCSPSTLPPISGCPGSGPARLTPARVCRGFSSFRQALPCPVGAPKPGNPAPGRPPRTKNRRPATRHDVGKTVKRDEPKKKTRRQKSK